MSGPALPHPFDLAPPLPTALATPSPSLLGDYVAFTSSTNLHPMIASLASTALNELVRCSQQPGRSLEATLNQCWLHLLVLHRQYNPVWESAVVWRGSYWQTANTLLSITGDVDVSEWQVKEGKKYAESSIQSAIRAFRLASGSLRAHGSEGSSSVGDRSTGGPRNGVIRPDVLVCLAHNPPDGPQTTVCSFVGENKSDPDQPTEATAKVGLAQNLVQLASAFETFGTSLGACAVNSMYTRLLVLRHGLIAVESKPDVGTFLPPSTSPAELQQALADAPPAEVFLRGRLLRSFPFRLEAGRLETAAPYVFWVERAICQLKAYHITEPMARLPFSPWLVPMPSSQRIYGLLTARDAEAAIAAVRRGKDAALFKARYGSPAPEAQSHSQRDSDNDDDSAGASTPRPDPISLDASGTHRGSASHISGERSGPDCDRGDAQDEEELPLGAEASFYAQIRVLVAALKDWRMVTVTTTLMEELATEVIGPLPVSKRCTGDDKTGSTDITSPSSCQSPPSSDIASSPVPALETPLASPERDLLGSVGESNVGGVKRFSAEPDLASPSRMSRS